MTISKAAAASQSRAPATSAEVVPMASDLVAADLLAAVGALCTPDERRDALARDPVLGSSDVLVGQWLREFPDDPCIEAFTLSIRLRRLAMLLDEGLIARGQKAGVKLNEILLMLALRRVGPGYSLRPTDILKMHSVTSGAVTYRIDQLIHQGFAERIADPSDRRGYLIRLTLRGREVIDDVILETARLADRQLAPLFALPMAREMLVGMLRFYEHRIEEDAVGAKTSTKSGPRTSAKSRGRKPANPE